MSRGPLTDSEVEQFHEAGYFIARELYDAEEMDLLSRAARHDKALDDHAIHRDDQRSTRTWLVATAMLGMVFLAGQAFEFTEFVLHDPPMKISTNPAASAFFTLTGFHGMHVLVGVVMLLTLAGISFRKGRLSTRAGLNLENVALYWHFVDIIWIVIFTVVYLLTATPGGG